MRARVGSAVWSRRDVLIVIAATSLVIVLGFARFPEITGSPLPYLTLAVAALVIVGLPAGLILLVTRASSETGQLTRRCSLLLSMVLGVLWIVYTLLTHFVIPNGEQPTINAILLWGVLSATALALLVGSGAVAWESRRFSPGFTTGLATGFLTGVVAMLTIGLMLDIGMGVLVRQMNAQELATFTHSGWANRQAWYYWNEEFFGSLGDFVLLALSGAALGAVGAGIGWFLARVLRRSRHPAHPAG